MKAQRGFTMFELVVVLVMIGILTAGLVPLLTARHANTMDQGEREALQTAREALIAYAINRGGLPAPLNSEASGFNATKRPNFPAGWTALNESFMPWNDAALAVNNFGPYRKYFWYDVRDDLRPQTTARTPVEFCQHIGDLVRAAVPPVTDPRVCAAPPVVGQEDRACSPAAPHSDPFNNAAFTLVSFGADGVPDMAHRALNILAPTPIRNYEHPARPVVRDRSGDADRPRFYDDLVASVSLAELESACAQRGLLTRPTVGPCAGGQRAVTLVNTSGGTDQLRFNTGTPPTFTCHPQANNTTVAYGCFPETEIFTVHNTAAECTGNTVRKGNSGQLPLNQLDTNLDGTVRFICPTSGPTACTVD